MLRSTRSDLLLAGVFAVVLLATLVAAPMVADARPASEIPVEERSDVDSLDSATGDAWTQVPAATVSLGESGSSVPASNDISIEQSTLQAVRTDDRLHLRLTWEDPTVDRSAGDIRTFPDAVAVQLPQNTSSRPPITMGGPDNRVNVWFWHADGESEELLAGGPGSTTQLDDGLVEGDAAHEDGRWQVVFSRPIGVDDDQRTVVPDDADLDIAVAVWNGSNMERSGQKSVSEWHYLALGPGPQGPPYQTILWIVAGIAIAGTTLVTIEGVRRTRSE